MSEEEIYHRTYLPDGPYEQPCDNGCHATPKPPSLSSQFGQLPSWAVPPGASQSPAKPAPPTSFTPQKYKSSQRRFRAYSYTGSNLADLYIVEKLDQNLPAYATPFEIKYSKLIGHAGGWDPVVDQNRQVVGHVGTISGGAMIVPQDSPNHGADLDKALADEVPVYVDSEVPSGWRRFYNDDVKFQVMTGIDGEVVIRVATYYNGLEDTLQLDDMIFIGAGVAKLVASAGRRILKSISRRVVQGLAALSFDGASMEVLQNALKRFAAKKAAAKAASAYIPQTGMPQGHFNAFSAAAKEQNVIAVVRNTNPASVKLIEQGCPGKPMHFKFNTSPSSGIVMAEKEADVAIAHAQRHFVVEADLVARRPVPGQMLNGKPVMEELPLSNPFWKLEKGQVIDPMLKKPVVGDYDLMGVIDPAAPGRNIALVASNGVPKADISSPIVKRFGASVNGKMDMPRVLHGAQDQFADFRKGATAFMPDGTVRYLPTEENVRQFYSKLGRQTIKGSYGPR